MTLAHIEVFGVGRDGERGLRQTEELCVHRIHSIVMGGRLKPPKRDVKDPDTIRGAGSNHGLTHPGRWRELAARPSDGEPGATGHIVSLGQKRYHRGKFIEGECACRFIWSEGGTGSPVGTAPGDRGSPGGRRHGGTDAGSRIHPGGPRLSGLSSPQNPAGVRPGAHRAQAGQGYTGFVCHAAPR